ncbi:MAG: alpha/beta fold hydrolase [Alphaproteobacteria bacterium]|nr:alpha/beta fold hydrolase [Alphaproteobacteria bacterium]
MRTLFRLLITLVVIVAVLAGIGYFMLRRGDIPYATLEQKYANPESEYVDLAGGVRMHFRDEGKADGPTLVMVHGYSASLHTWASLVPLLGDRYRIVTLDLPGHGLTQAPPDYDASIAAYVELLEAFAEAKQLARFTLAGSSMGGHAAWEYALTHPDRLEGLILVDAAGWRDAREDPANQPLVFRLLANPFARMVLRDLDNSALIRGGLENSFSNPAFVDDAMVARYSDLARAPGHRKILMDLFSPGTRTEATAERLGAIRTPTLILWGEDDNLISAANAQRFAAAIPGADLVTWTNLGHIPQEENPAGTADAIGDFLARIHAPRAPATPEAAPETVTTP